MERSHFESRGLAWSASYTYIVVLGIIATHSVAAQRCLCDKIFYLNVKLLQSGAAICGKGLAIHFFSLLFFAIYQLRDTQRVCLTAFFTQPL